MTRTISHKWIWAWSRLDLHRGKVGEELISSRILRLEREGGKETTTPLTNRMLKSDGDICGILEMDMGAARVQGDTGWKTPETRFPDQENGEG